MCFVKNCKGFTLIELLAIIVIIAIILLISVPLTFNVVKRARLSAAEDTTYSFVDIASSFANKTMLSNGGNMPNELSFDCLDGVCTLENYDSYIA